MWLSSLSVKQREALLGLAHNVVVSDGLLDPNEEGMLNDFKREMGLSQTVEPEYLELSGIDELFPTREARVIVIIHLLRLSYADGSFDIEEECLLREVSRTFSMGDNEFLLLDNWVRRLLALEEEARSFIAG